MILTHSLPEFSTALQTKLTDNMETLGLKAIFYGDQDRLSTTPIACVEPGNKAQAFGGGGANRMLAVNLTTYILVYSSLVGSGQVNRLVSDDIAEAIEDLIHADRTLSNGAPADQGIVIECHVSDISSGYATKANSIVRASRITVDGLSQNRLPS